MVYAFALFGLQAFRPARLTSRRLDSKSTGQMMHNSRVATLGWLLAALLSQSACVPAPDIIQVGPWFPSRPYSEVLVLDSRALIDKPWGAIAVIHSEKFPADDKGAVERQKEEARKLAGTAGADGIIIAEETTMPGSQLGVYQEPETYISALAFKYVTDISTAAK